QGVKFLNTGGCIIGCYINLFASDFRTNVATVMVRFCAKIIFMCFGTVYGKILC
ncbi:hypothetical protein BDF19DRAFT_450667, partial [Syncephalis fuscata]